MIVPPKPFWMTKRRYLTMLGRMFDAQIPTYLHTGFNSFAVLLTIISLNCALLRAYPNRNALQSVIDAYSAIILEMDRVYHESIANGKDGGI